MALRWHRGDDLLNKSLSFVTLRLNPWCHMDYFTDLLATFLDVDRVNYIAVYVRARELSESIKNILICVPKTNEAFTGLERHGVNDNISILGWSNPLSYRKAVCNFSFLSSLTHLCNGLHACLHDGYTRRTGHTGSSACVGWLRAGDGPVVSSRAAVWHSCSSWPCGGPYRGQWGGSGPVWRACYGALPPVGSAWGEGWGCLGESTGSSAPCPAAAAYSEDTSMHRQGPAK